MRSVLRFLFGGSTEATAGDASTAAKDVVLHVPGMY
jgi:hypothetical protein